MSFISMCTSGYFLWTSNDYFDIKKTEIENKTKNPDLRTLFEFSPLRQYNNKFLLA